MNIVRFWRVISASLYPFHSVGANGESQCSRSERHSGFLPIFRRYAPYRRFLYACVRQTIDQDLPNETKFLEKFDRFRALVEFIVDMPDRTLENLLGFLRQNEGILSKRAREKEFAALTDDETRKSNEHMSQLSRCTPRVKRSS